MTLRGIRGRLVVTVIGLVALTSLVLGVASYAYVATSLRDQQLASAREVTAFNVTVLAPDRLAKGATATSPETAALATGFASRGIAGTIVDFGDGNPFVSGLTAQETLGALSADLRAIVAVGNVGYQRLTLDGVPYLVTGARMSGGPQLYFLFDASAVEDAIAQLGRALLVGGLLLVALAALAGGVVARGLLRPVRDAALAAERIAGGDLSARLDSDPHDEFGQWAASFNRMAASVEEHVDELQAGRAREQRFAADVSHELRTPLTALVSEAGLLRAHLDELPEGTRRVAELLVADVARLRSLVDDLMEVSRFDAGAEEPETAEFALARFVRSVVAARLPGADTSLPGDEMRIAADARRLERVLGNLLDNARIHGEGRAVDVEARVEDVLPGEVPLTGAVQLAGELPRAADAPLPGELPLAAAVPRVGELPLAAAVPLAGDVPPLGDVPAGALPRAKPRALPPPEGARAEPRVLPAPDVPRAEPRVLPAPDVPRAVVVLAVSDRGPGVRPDQLDGLFDRFAKADPSRHRGGSGLGLAIAREHARVLGGTLSASLRPGGGMRFELRVPVTRPLPARDLAVTDGPETPIPLEPHTESIS